MSFKKTLNSTFARIAFSLFLTSTAFAAPNDISFSISQDGKSITYSHDHLENYNFRSIIEGLFGADISWDLLNTLANHQCNSLDDKDNMYVQGGIAYTYDFKLIHKNLPWSYTYQKTHANPKLVKAVFNSENNSFDLTYQYYYGALKGKGYYDFTVRIKFFSLKEQQEVYFEHIKNIARVDQSNIVMVETKNENPLVEIKLIPGVNNSRTVKILNSISSLEEKLQQLDQAIELEKKNDDLNKIFDYLKLLQGIFSAEKVQLSSLNNIIELGTNIVFQLETLLFNNGLIEADWYLEVLKMNNQIADKFKEKKDDDAKEFEVMRSLQGALESLNDRLDIVAKIVEKYQSEGFSDAESEEEVINAEQVENGRDNIIISPIAPPPAPEIMPVQPANPSAQNGDLLSQIRAGTTLKKTEHKKMEITSDLASVIRAAIDKRNLASKENENSDSEDDPWSSDEE